MGQKVNPHGLRVGVIKDWDARWYADKKNFANFLIEDNDIRKFLKTKLFTAGVSRIEIERAANKITVNVYCGKPGIVIGRGGAGTEGIKQEVEKKTGKAIILNIFEIKSMDTDAQLVAENVASQIERRISFRRAMKQVISRTMKSGAKGIKTLVSGRLNGADIARREGYREGSIPLQTIRADIDYGFSEAKTTYGRIGCKVWIYKGEVMPKKKAAKPQEGGK
jgi:small subunit ribosomal protein S3